MKITKTQLKQIIKEELSAVISEGKEWIQIIVPFRYEAPGATQDPDKDRRHELTPETKPLYLPIDGEGNAILTIGHGHEVAIPQEHFKIVHKRTKTSWRDA